MPTAATVNRKLRALADGLLDLTLRQTLYMIRCRFALHRSSEHSAARAPVFALSTGRVGTQTLAALLALARQTHAYHEPLPLLYGLGQAVYRCASCAAVDEILMHSLSLARGHLIETARQCGARYVETSPQVTFVAHGFRALEPDTKFIHLVRDPRDVVRSAMRRKWYEGNIADATRISPVSGDARARWARYSPFEKNLWLWQETNVWIAKLCANLPASACILIRAEDLFAEERATLEKLYAFVDSEVPSNRRLRRVLRMKLNRQLTGAFPEAEAWDPDTYERLREVCGAAAETYGYRL